MAHALDVIDQSGIAFRRSRADTDEKRREVPGHRVVAIDDLQQGLLFAEEIIIRAQNDFQKTARRYSRRLEFGNGLSQPLDLKGELFLDADDRGGRAHRVRGDQHPFEDPIGVLADQISVFVSPRLAFGGVTNHILR